MGRKLNSPKFFSFILDCISFNTPQAIVFDLSAIILILAVLPFEYLHFLPIRCVFKNAIFPVIFQGSCPTTGFFAGCECPACGLTRGMSSLLHGDLESAMAFNRATPIVLALMLVVIGINIYKIINSKSARNN